MANRFWVNTAGGTWDATTTTNWSTTTGGGTGASVPGSADVAIFDGNSGSNTITTNYAPTVQGLTLASGFTGTVTFGATNTFTVANAGAGILSVANGTLNTNNQTVNTDIFSVTGNNNRTVNLGSSTITCIHNGTGAIAAATVVNLTFNAGTSTFAITTAVGTISSGGLAFWNVTFSGTTTGSINGSNSFNNLSITGGAVVNATFTLGAATTQTVSGTFTSSGNSLINRLNLASGTVGSTATISTANAPTLARTDFMDIAATGAGGTWSGTSLGDQGGNSGITFTVNAGTTNSSGGVFRYWVNVAGGNSTNTAMWSTSSGGASGATLPLPQDTIIFDANSITTTGKNIVMGMPRWGHDVDFSAVLHTPSITYNTAATAPSVFGSLNLGTAGTVTVTTAAAIAFTFRGRGTHTLTSGGLQLTTTGILGFNGPGGTYTLQDASTSGSGGITSTGGTINTNNFACSWANFTCAGAVTKTLTLGSTLLSLTGTGTVFLVTSGFVINPGTSTIAITDTSATSKTFNGAAGRVFNNLSITGGGSGAIIFVGANTFANLPQITGGTASITWPGSTTTIFTSGGNFGNGSNVITMTSSAGSATLSFGSQVNADFLNLTNIIATTTTPAYAGANSTDGGGNTGWTFTVPPATGTSNLLTMGIT